MRKLDMVTCNRCNKVRPMAVAAREGWAAAGAVDDQKSALCRECQTADERAAADAAAGEKWAEPLASQGDLGPLRGVVGEEFVAAMAKVEPGTDVLDRDELIRTIALGVAARVPYGDPMRNGMAGTAFLSALQEVAGQIIGGQVKG